MKKAVLMMVMMGLVLVGFSQRQLPMSEYVVSDALYTELSASQVEQMRSDNPAELIRMNYTMMNKAVVVFKLWDGNFQQMGSLEQYLPAGMTYLEEEIIQKGIVNPYKWNLPQDDYRYNVFKLRRNRAYVVVLPKTVLEERIQAQLKSYVY